MFRFARLGVYGVLLVLFPHKIAAQGESNIWYFGYGAGLDFNSGSPVAITDGQIMSIEGCAGMCTAAGQLLFYTDGLIVWDRNHNPMPNGTSLISHISSTQSSVICPDPGNTNRYYIFTADQGGYFLPNRGIRYSIVDMALNSGFGDVSVLNQVLLPAETTEKMVAVRHCNGQDFWIVTHKFNSNEFCSFLLSAAGVNTTPVVSPVGLAHSNVSGTYTETIGYMKISPNGKMLALANYGQGFAEYFDFDRQTGLISNPVSMNYLSEINVSGPYGVSFSPDNTRLYISFSDIFSTNWLYQYDLLAGSPAAVVASQTVIFSDDGLLSDGFGALQIGPDGKIYMSKWGADSIDVINFPNQLGANCGYVHNAIGLSGKMSLGGLPNNIDAYTSRGGVAFGPDRATCGDTIHLHVREGLHPLWSTGETTDSITVSLSGTYWVQVPFSDCNYSVDTINVSVGNISGYAPVNVFTPNGDLINDVFSVHVTGFDAARLSVYDRWGCKLFEGATAWDGKYNGHDAPDGTYFWMATLPGCDGKPVTKKGFVELMR